MQELATSGFELRFDLAGRAAVRVAGGPVAPRHVEPVPPRGAVGGRGALRHGDRLAARARRARRSRRRPRALCSGRSSARPRCACRPPRRPPRRSPRTCWSGSRIVCARTSRRCRRWPTGRSRACSSRQDLELLPGELERTGREALRRLSGAREVMGVLVPGARREPEDVEATLRAELDGAGRAVTVTGPAGETPRDAHPRPGLGGVRAHAGARPAARDVRTRT